MRVVKNMQDVQKVLNELLDWKQQMQSANINLSGRRVINAGASQSASDYVIKSELQTALAGSVQTPTSFYTATFNPPDGAATGSLSPPFNIGTGRSGKPTQCWITANGAPVGTNVTCNFQYQGANLLTNDLVLVVGSTYIASASLILPTPVMAQAQNINMIMTSANTATGVTGGIVIQLLTVATTTQQVQ